MTNTINLKAIKNCLMAVSKDKEHLTGVYVEDRGGYRHYVGTNGYILVHAFNNLDKDDKLEKPLILKPRGKIGGIKLFDYGWLTIINDESALIESPEIKAVFDIIDETYPSYQRVIPYDAPEAKEYARFDDKYLKILHIILNKNYNTRPLMEERHASALWKNEIDGVNYEIVLMPMRLF